MAKLHIEDYTGMSDLLRALYINIENKDAVDSVKDIIDMYENEYVDMTRKFRGVLPPKVNHIKSVIKSILEGYNVIPITDKKTCMSFIRSLDMTQKERDEINKILIGCEGNMVTYNTSIIQDLKFNLIMNMQAAKINDSIDMTSRNRGIHNIKKNNRFISKQIKEFDSIIHEFDSSDKKIFVFGKGKTDVATPVEMNKLSSNIRLKTGIPAIDDLYGGLKPATLIVGYSITGGGKSIFSTNLVANIWKNGRITPEIEEKAEGRKPVIVFFTHENTLGETFENLLRCVFGDSETRRLLYSSPEEIQAAIESVTKDDGFELRVEEIEEGTLTIDGIRARLTTMKDIEGLEPIMLIDDYVGLLKRDTNSTTPLGDLGQGLKNISKEFMIPVVTTAQLNFNQYLLMRAYPSDDLIKSFVVDSIAIDKSIQRKVDLGLFVYRHSHNQVDHLGIMVNKVRSGASACHSDGTARVSYFPFEEDREYGLGSSHYSKYEDMIDAYNNRILSSVDNEGFDDVVINDRVKLPASIGKIIKRFSKIFNSNNSPRCKLDNSHYLKVKSIKEIGELIDKGTYLIPKEDQNIIYRNEYDIREIDGRVYDNASDIRYDTDNREPIKFDRIVYGEGLFDDKTGMPILVPTEMIDVTKSNIPKINSAEYNKNFNNMKIEPDIRHKRCPLSKFTDSVMYNAVLTEDALIDVLNKEIPEDEKRIEVIKILHNAGLVEDFTPLWLRYTNKKTYLEHLRHERERVKEAIDMRTKLYEYHSEKVVNEFIDKVEDAIKEPQEWLAELESKYALYENTKATPNNFTEVLSTVRSIDLMWYKLLTGKIEEYVLKQGLNGEHSVYSMIDNIIDLEQYMVDEGSIPFKVIDNRDRKLGDIIVDNTYVGIDDLFDSEKITSIFESILDRHFTLTS